MKYSDIEVMAQNTNATFLYPKYVPLVDQESLGEDNECSWIPSSQGRQSLWVDRRWSQPNKPHPPSNHVTHTNMYRPNYSSLEDCELLIHHMLYGIEHTNKIKYSNANNDHMVDIPIKIVRRRKIEPGTHCLRMCQKFHVKFPPITLYDGV